MKLTSPHLPTLTQPTIVDVGNAIDELAAIHITDPAREDCYIQIESADGTGAFIQAITVGEGSRWRVEVSNSNEASLRGLREPATRGRAVELLGNFVRGDRSMGNGTDWIDVDLAGSQPSGIPKGLAVGILLLLGVAVATWFYAHRA